MTEQHKKEKEYIKSVYTDKLPNKNPFIIRVDDDKEMFFIAPPDMDFRNDLKEISDYRALYDTVLDLRDKVIFSLDKAIDFAYSKKVLEEYNMIFSCGDEEWNAYYYLENALFRIETLWDILAQIVNIKYKLGIEKEKVYHNRVFSLRDDNVKKIWDGEIPEEIENIARYINEEDDTSINDGMWKGNYKYINSLRNSMTHRISISRNSFSSYSFEAKQPPMYILKRMAECFATLEEYIYEIFEQIMEERDDFELLK